MENQRYVSNTEVPSIQSSVPLGKNNRRSVQWWNKYDKTIGECVLMWR